jgi:hypothetical protein
MLLARSQYPFLVSRIQRDSGGAILYEPGGGGGERGEGRRKDIRKIEVKVKTRLSLLWIWAIEDSYVRQIANR